MGHKLTQDSTLKELFEGVLAPHGSMSARMRHISDESTAINSKINVRASYIALKDVSPTVDEFVDVVYHKISRYCIPRSKIRKEYEKAFQLGPDEGSEIFNQISDEAASLFIKAKKNSSRSGEIGELVLYIFTEWVLQAPQILSKMYLKTSHNMPVHGTDGIHAKYDEDEGLLYIYWGESKAHKSLSSALSDALESIGDFVKGNKEAEEIRLIAAYQDFGDISDIEKDALLAYLNPWEEAYNQRKTVFTCLLMFSEGEYSKIGKLSGSAEAEAALIAKIKSKLSSFIKNTPEQVAKNGLSAASFEFFLFPVPSVQTMRDKFQAKIGYPS